MADHIAGVAIDVNLTVFEDINACDYYPTPTPTPTNTGTPTPTPTPTPTDARACRTYLLGTASMGTFTYTDCTGTTQSVSVNWPNFLNICAKEGSVSIVSGNGTITDIGTC
jgi:hypothetical protein